MHDAQSRSTHKPDDNQQQSSMPTSKPIDNSQEPGAHDEPPANSSKGENPDAADQLRERKHHRTALYSTAGTDVANMPFSIPIWLFEPTSTLIRMAETFEFSYLLDRAACCPDPILRHSLIAAFVVSTFAHTERVRKPFNPLLGETFEYIDPVTDMKFYAEQVSHHPPISVSHVDTPTWSAGEVVDANAKFQGNSVQITSTGDRHIVLKNWNERYTWTLPIALISNVFVGSTYVDHHGTMEITNHRTKTVAKLEFAKTGWFSAGRYAVAGDMYDENDEKLVCFKGEWNHHFDSYPADAAVPDEHDDGTAKSSGATTHLWMAGNHLLTEEEGGGPLGVLPNCTKFTKKLLAFDADYAEELPPTDSRLRPDRIALQRGDTLTAAKEKLRIEQMQRERRASIQAAAKKKNLAPKPKYFRRAVKEDSEWVPTETYWKESRSFVDERRCEASLW